MNNEFDDSDFIPNTVFCEAIDDESPLIILKVVFDGRICNCFLNQKGTDYFEMLKQTNNKFLKLAFFECLKSQISFEEIQRILNTEELIPLYYEVAENIVRQRNPRFRPMWLIKDYINLAYPTISNKFLFDNIGNILMLIINDENKTHFRDISYILENFLGLKMSILKTVKIPESIFHTIDYWIHNIFNGNLSWYDTTRPFLNKLFDFYDKLDIDVDISSKREVIYDKYRQFYEDKLNFAFTDINDLQSIEPQKNFLNYMLEITQKYCMNQKEKDALVHALKTKYEELHRKSLTANENLPSQIGTITITNDEIEAALKDFAHDNILSFLQKLVENEHFIPDRPDLSGNQYIGFSSLLPTRVFDDSTIRDYKAGMPIIEQSFYYKFNVNKKLVFLDHKLKDFDKFQFLGSVYAIIHHSNLIDMITKKIFQLSLEHFGRGDYFHSIQTVVFQIERILRKLCEEEELIILYKDNNRVVPKGLEFLIGRLREKKILSERLIFFIEWLLSTSPEYMSENIRNKIAHGINSLEQFETIFTRKNALAIILIYLYLSKYKNCSIGLKE